MAVSDWEEAIPVKRALRVGPYHQQSPRLNLPTMGERGDAGGSLLLPLLLPSLNHCVSRRAPNHSQQVP